MSLPEDRAVPGAVEVPASASSTRTFTTEDLLLQREPTTDVAGTAWTAASLVVLATGAGAA